MRACSSKIEILSDKFLPTCSYVTVVNLKIVGRCQLRCLQETCAAVGSLSPSSIPLQPAPPASHSVMPIYDVCLYVVTWHGEITVVNWTVHVGCSKWADSIKSTLQCMTVWWRIMFLAKPVPSQAWCFIRKAGPGALRWFSSSWLLSLAIWLFSLDVSNLVYELTPFLVLYMYSSVDAVAKILGDQFKYLNYILTQLYDIPFALLGIANAIYDSINFSKTRIEWETEICQVIVLINFDVTVIAITSSGSSRCFQILLFDLVILLEVITSWQTKNKNTYV